MSGRILNLNGTSLSKSEIENEMAVIFIDNTQMYLNINLDITQLCVYINQIHLTFNNAK